MLNEKKKESNVLDIVCGEDSDKHCSLLGEFLLLSVLSVFLDIFLLIHACICGGLFRILMVSFKI